MGYGLFPLNCRTNLGILTLTLTKRVQAAILTAAIPTNASEKAQLTLTLTLTLTVILTLTLTHFSPSPNPIPNSNPNPLHYIIQKCRNSGCWNSGRLPTKRDLDCTEIQSFLPGSRIDECQRHCQSYIYSIQRRVIQHLYCTECTE